MPKLAFEDLQYERAESPGYVFISKRPREVLEQDGSHVVPDVLVTYIESRPANVRIPRFIRALYSAPHQHEQIVLWFSLTWPLDDGRETVSKLSCLLCR
jgi:hypothetical protein